jgi:hypothetical protein
MTSQAVRLGPWLGAGHGTESMVKHVYSVKLTPNHVDVTDRPLTYASPKKFVFVSKKQLRWMDANRRCRQTTKNITPVEDISPDSCLIDNREKLDGMAEAPEEFVRLDAAVKPADAHLRSAPVRT